MPNSVPRPVSLAAASLAVTAGSLVLALAATGCGSGLSAAAAAAGSSQTRNQSVAAPANLGYAWNGADHTLRPIIGVVGSSRVGASVVSGSSYTGGAASAASAVALLVRTDGGVDRVTLPDGATVTLPGVSAAADATVHFSPLGTAAVVFSRGGTAVTLLTSLTGTPVAASLRASAALVDATVSDKGTVAVLQKQGTGAQLAVLGAGGAAQPIASVSGSGAVSFIARREDALLTDTAANTLTLVRGLGASATLETVTTGNLLKSPGAVGTGQGGRWAVVANAGESSVVRVDLTGASAPQRLAVPVQPSLVEPLLGDGSFRFSDVGKSPAWVADLTASSPAVLFVPAVSGS